MGRQKQGCKCLDEADKKMAERNGLVLRTIPFQKGVVSRALIEVVKRDSSSRQKPPRLAANFCPFCGVPYTADTTGLEAAPDKSPAKKSVPSRRASTRRRK